MGACHKRTTAKQVRKRPLTRVELAKLMAREPIIDDQRYLARWAEMDYLLSRFSSGEISREEMLQHFPADAVKDKITLDYPGPVAGFLLRVGLGLGLRYDDLMETARHERAHYYVAREAGLNPRFGFVFTVDRSNGGCVVRMRAFVEISAGPTLTPENLAEVCLAPDDPSSSDLAKLSEEGRAAYRRRRARGERQGRAASKVADEHR